MKKLLSKILMHYKSPRNLTRDLSLTIFVVLLLSTIFSLINPNFIGKYNLISIGQSLAPYAILALGVLVPISMGGTDLSIGAVCIGSAVVAGRIYNLGVPLWICLIIMIIFGTLIGFINGLFIAKYKIQPFIVTLGTMMFVRGATAIFATTSTVLFPTDSWFNKMFSTYNGFPISFLWIILFTIIIYVLFRKTKTGRYILSIGSGEQATRISGVNVEKYKIIGYTISGLMAGIAAIFFSASFATVTVATGNGMELDAIASVYIGGTAATGGLVNVFGSLIGSLMMVILRSGLNYSLAKLNININSTYITYVVSGIIVILAVLISNGKNNNNKSIKKINPNYKAIKRLTFSCCSIIMVAFLTLTSCGVINLTNKKDNKLITLLMKSEGIDFWTDFEEGAKEAGNKYGYRVISRGTEGESPSYLPKSLELASTLLSENPSGFGISAIANGYVDILKEAYNRNIPVVQFDSGLYQEDLEMITSSSYNPLCSYIKASNYDNAGLAAKEAFNLVRDDIIASEKYNVGIIQHENTDNASLRAKGFKDKFLELAQSDPKTKDKCEVLIEIKPSSDNNAYKEALEFLYEKETKLYFMTSEYVINQVADAVFSSSGKYDGLKFVGFDVCSKAIEWISENNASVMLGTISQNSYQMGYLTAEALIKIDKGETVEKEIIVPGKWINKDNINE